MQTIDDVIKRLDEIIIWAEKNQSTVGYFAVLYRRMTVAVKVGIEKNQFEDGVRMEKLDIVFAKRYFEAFDLVQKKTATTKAWHSAFEATKSNEVTVIQHLLLGINAHINLDLGIAASNISKKEDILKLEKDFKQINTIISALIDDTKSQLSKIWLPFRIFTVLLKTESDGIINFSIKVARTFSWENAKILTNLEDGNKPNYIIEMDKNVAYLADRIINPKWFMKTVLWIMRKGESGTVNQKIQFLK